MNPGIYKGISHKDYHAMTDIVSNSYLGRLDRCPAAAKVAFPDSPAMAFGRAFHCYVLDGVETYYELFAVADRIDMRTKDGKAWWNKFRENNPDKEIISLDDHEKIEKMRQSIEEHPLAWLLIQQGISEQTLYGMTRTRASGASAALTASLTVIRG